MATTTKYPATSTPLRYTSFMTKVLFFLVLLAIAVISWLTLEKQHITIYAQGTTPAESIQPSPADNTSLTPRLCSSSIGDEKYYCKDGEIWHDKAGTSEKITSCISNNKTCYALNNTVTQQYCATCLYNPPKQSVGGAGCPTDGELAANKADATCHLLNPSVDIRDTNITQAQIDKYIELYESTFVGKQIRDSGGGIGTAAEFEKRVNYIISDYKKAGINPIFGLAYWKTESLFSTVGTIALGCAPDSKSSPINDFYWEVDCSAGLTPAGFLPAMCMRANNPKDASCGYQTQPGGSVPPQTFDDFAWVYGPFTDLRGGHGNCTYTYNTAIGVVKELGMCKVAPTGSVKIIGFDAQHTEWINQLLAKYSNTNLSRLIQGTTIMPVAEQVNWTIGSSEPGGSCTIQMYQYPNQSMFDILLTHEFGHVIDFCTTSKDSLHDEHTTVFKDEKGVTDYARNNCVSGTEGRGRPSEAEDYAEMISYYLNPGANVVSDCKSNPNAVEANPYNNGGFPEHYNLAKQILGTYP